MELLIVIGIAFFFGAVALSTVAQRTPQPPQVVYIRAEQIDTLHPHHSEGGIAIIMLCLVVLVAISLF